MNTHHQKIDWNSPDVLQQILSNIEGPLSSIIEANKIIIERKEEKKLSKLASNIIFSNSQEIADLLKKVMDEVQSKSIKISDDSQPEIFKIYKTNPKVKSLCKDKIIPDKISKTDQGWLLGFEKEVFDKIKNSQLNLYDLSYKLAVSERQLHRKIKNLLCLTPNKYIRVLKLYKAKEFLDQYLYNTVSEISYAVGYCDTHYFSKIFHQQYGISPKQVLISKRD